MPISWNPLLFSGLLRSGCVLDRYNTMMRKIYAGLDFFLFFFLFAHVLNKTKRGKITKINEVVLKTMIEEFICNTKKEVPFQFSLFTRGK